MVNFVSQNVTMVITTSGNSTRENIFCFCAQKKKKGVSKSLKL
jgi:hypothetical protein